MEGNGAGVFQPCLRSSPSQETLPEPTQKSAGVRAGDRAGPGAAVGQAWPAGQNPPDEITVWAPSAPSKNLLWVSSWGWAWSQRRGQRPGKRASWYPEQVQSQGGPGGAQQKGTGLRCGGRAPLASQFCRAAVPRADPQQGVLPPCVPEQGEEERQRPQDLQPPPPPGPPKEGQEEKSSGDERPATEPLPKALDTPLSEGDEPATLPAQRDHGHSVQMEGYLGRKHDLEGPNKKASNRCVCVCVCRGCGEGAGRHRSVWGGGVPSTSTSGLVCSWAPLRHLA